MYDKPLIILEMANNHMGELSHGLRIINDFKAVTAPYEEHFDFSFKLQLRDTSFIHPDYQNRMDISQIKRFTETKPPQHEFQMLKDEIERVGFISMCTPFDEPSVAVMLQMNFDMYKIASCSFADWPLMEEIVQIERPFIISTAGAQICEIDNVVSFFTNRKKSFAIMHCVAAYPTENAGLELNQIDYLKNRYPDVSIGYSTHEKPDNLSAVQMAVAKGAVVFEKHVGVPTKQYMLNDYSCTPIQFSKWLTAMKEAYEVCGVTNRRMSFSIKEERALKGLYRGVFAKRDMDKGEQFTPQDVFCAIPAIEGQVIARQLSKYVSFIAKTKIKANEAIILKNVELIDKRETVRKIVLYIKKMLADANVYVPDGISCAAYAHYGLDRFDEVGAVLINLLNREYSKTLLIMFAGQRYPLHSHKSKEETFYILSGELIVELDGEIHELKKGDMLTINREQNHSFYTKIGAIMEEISTTYIAGDSYYDDTMVLSSDERKTVFGLYKD
ncbi:MAG: N-acetylneuraminate synthase family protein [Lachnospiraceae bacterium]|jgi:sialic acid synthase SpsE/mannose-6-phosphate isomerase-like protein (cupin superfamily)|nr:N-acetylneuraminate synthase family protein [Lachnospiraceae bacterium]